MNATDTIIMIEEYSSKICKKWSIKNFQIVLFRNDRK